MGVKGSSSNLLRALRTVMASGKPAYTGRKNDDMAKLLAQMKLILQGTHGSFSRRFRVSMVPDA